MTCEALAKVGFVSVSRVLTKRTASRSTCLKRTTNNILLNSSPENQQKLTASTPDSCRWIQKVNRGQLHLRFTLQQLPFNLPTSTDLRTAKMQATTRKHHDPLLGNLGTLPPELRFEVFSYLVPQDFRQTFEISGDEESVAPSFRQPACLAIFYTSKKLRDEASQAVMGGRACEFTITKTGYRTNFPFCDTLMSPQERNNVINMSVSKAVNFVPCIPHPRCAEDIAAVRRNVAKIVRYINRGERELPPVTASIFSALQRHLRLAYNDYAMLLGPLAGLSNVNRGVKISCSSPLTPGLVDSKCLEQCNLIETAMQDCHAFADLVLQQQAKIDIKLTIAMYYDPQPFAQTLGLALIIRPIGLQAARTLKEALHEVKKLHAFKISASPDAMVVDLPAWMHEVYSKVCEFGDQTHIPEHLITTILGDRLRFEYLAWAAGHQTLINPYWQ